VAKRQSKQKIKPEGNGISDLIKELWNSAVTLRGSIEPADYKRYVLPIIFLRFLSMRFEKRRLELVEKISDHTSDYYTKSKKEAEAILNDPDEYRSVGAFVVPEKARWDYILQHAQDDDIRVKLDDALETLETTYADKLRGLLPRIYAGSNMEREHVTGLINLFSKDIFKQEHGGVDVLGRVYEYFIGEFASSEGKRGGEYFTPQSIVQCLVRMLEPEEGIVYDPCCGSGGMFVQSDIFTHHNHKLSFFGQENKDFTNRLCKMNLFIHGIDGNIQPGNTYFDDKHATLKADYIIANPPFNDGSKSEKASTLSDLRGLAVDTVNNEIFVNNITSIMVFGRTDSGNIAPLRTISGVSTGLNGPEGLAVDTVHNQIFVANVFNDSITVYGRTDSGNIAPLRTISGASTGLSGPQGIAVDMVKNEIFVANNVNSSITIYGRTDSGNTAPIRTISGASTGLSSPDGIALW
jgi:DNA-binding beta-propeller fold protein YncE